MLLLFYSSSNDRWIVLIILLLLFSIPMMLFPVPKVNDLFYLEAVSKRFMAGELQHVDTWDNTSFLFLLIFSPIHQLVGYSQGVSIVIASLTILWAASNVTLAINQYTNTAQKNVLPAFLFYFLALLSLPSLFFTPSHLSLLLVSLGFSRLLAALKGGRKNDDNWLATGFYFGLSVIVLPPTILLPLTIIVSIALYATFSSRQITSYIIGSLLPSGVLLLIYYLIEDLPFVWDHFYLYNLKVELQEISLGTIELLKLIVLGLFLITFLPSVFSLTIVHFQNVYNYQLFAWTVISVVIIFFFNGDWSYWYLLVVPATYFATMLLNTKKVSFFSELLAIVLVVSSVLASYYYLFPTIPLRGKNVPETSELIIPLQTEVNTQSIWVTSDQYWYYDHYHPSTPFLKPELYSYHLQNLEQEKIAIQWYQYLSENPPDIIIDPTGKVERIFYFLPFLSKNYVPQGEGLYLIED